MNKKIKTTISPAMEQLAGEVNKVVKTLVQNDFTFVKKHKRFHDSVWGTIVLEPHEVTLINTPLFQRLRKIRQLGSSHLVFPGATHTRFEHTLGVVHLAGRMGNHLRATKKASVSENNITNLRMAALCHDLGHGPFSHYSEKFFNQMSPFKQMAKPNAAEILSKFIVTSEVMRKMFIRLNKKYGTKLKPDFIADVITGDLKDKQRYLSEIVHGPFDADKLDYLTRDGQHCGMPIYVDTDRIFSSMKIGIDGEKHRLVGKKRAVHTLANLVHHKHFMHAVVHQHDVSRAFKCMCLNAFRCAVENNTSIDGKIIRTPADFLYFDDEMVLSPRVVFEGKAANIFSAMRKRKLFKVAIRFKEFPKDKKPYELQLEIADLTGVPAEEIAVDCATKVKNSEAKNMLIDTGDGLIPLGKLMKLKEQGTPLQNYFARHLVLCPSMYVNKVRKNAKKLGL